MVAKQRVAEMEVGCHFRGVDGEVFGEKRCADGGAPFQRAADDRPFVQHVAPGDYRRLAGIGGKEFGGAVAVGDDQGRHDVPNMAFLSGVVTVYPLPCGLRLG